MTATVFSLKVALRGSKPPIWRRLLVADTVTLADLHETIQGAMGWGRCHAHAFDIGGKQYGDPEFLEDISDEAKTTLKTVYKSGATSFKYTYDFGDHWEHTVTLEKAQPAIEGQVYPICVAGKRNCPPEDCGGVWGYEELLQILADPANPGRKERLEWLGDDFDPEDFSIGTTNERIAACSVCEEI